MIDLITTMNKKIFDEYGKNICDSFTKFSKNNLRLNIIFEGDTNLFECIETRNIRVVKFECREWEVFFKKFGHLKEANGFKFEETVINNRLHFNVHGPDFRWNAVKFSFKVFSVFLASKFQDLSEKFCWIDADTIFFKPMSDKDLTKFLPHDNELMTYLGRSHFPPDYPHSETGFLGFNKGHLFFKDFIQTAINIYMSGEIFTLPRLHDCLVYDTTRKIFETKNVKFRNLSGIHEKEEHPFVLSELGDFLDHLKGNRKIQGFSHERLINH